MEFHQPKWRITHDFARFYMILPYFDNRRIEEFAAA